MESNLSLEDKLEKIHRKIDAVYNEIGKRIVGQQKMLEGMMMAMIARGHVLLEGVPGLAKTLAVRSLAEVFDTGFQRIQFTPDLLPADLIGTMIYRPQTGEFVPRKGPVFSNVLLADEINRAPAKVQSALLEAMQERQVTIGDYSYPLVEPFFVLATQNPIEHEGTYPLPEAQVDRFLLKLAVDYPTEEEERQIIRRVGEGEDGPLEKQLNHYILKKIRETVSEIALDEKIESYIVSLVRASRKENDKEYPFSRYIEFGASPRASIYLFKCSKIKAMMQKRTYVLPEDVKEVALDVLRHRIVLSYEAEAEELSSDEVIKQLLMSVPIP